MRQLPLTLAASLAVVACDPARISSSVSAVSVDAAIDAAPPDYIGSVLTCGTPASTGGLAAGGDLQRYDLDLGVFPDARCNDGTPAVFYFRPGSTPAGLTRWVIELQGGGGCTNPDGCARRWCHVGTNFGMTQMTSTLAPAGGVQMDGIEYRGAAFANPFNDYNHVFVRYCSSDEWSGRSGPLPVDATDPVTGAPVQFQIDFRGADILDAVITTLRQTAGVPPVYTLQPGATVPMPDLDTAGYVLLAGASAGGGGVINNVDRLAATLVAANPAVEVQAMIDSTFGPNASDLEWSTSKMCAAFGACNWQAVLAAGTAMYPRDGDDSCQTWHAANDPANAWRCDDTDHVIRNHLTTPMFVRKGQRDMLLSENLISNNVSVDVGVITLITLPLFEQLVRDQLDALANVQATAEEGAAIPTAPGSYGPPCPQHDTLETNSRIFDVRIGAAAVGYSMFDVFTAWRTGAAPAQMVWAPGRGFLCR
jgi:hypothetical protein